MTNLVSLADFFDDTDIESLRATALESHGIDIQGVYCLHTGRKVGTFDEFVIQFACDEESCDSEEDLIDCLIARVVASMRPSPMLNRPDRITLLNLAARHPVDIMAYLVNRLHSNRYLATHRVENLDPYVARIATHIRWTELAAAGVDLTPWIHCLLELDAKRNLHDLTPPMVSLDRLNRLIQTADGVSLLSFVTPENSAVLLKTFERWTFERVGEFERRDREALREAQWMRGNSLSQPAYSRSWMENPELEQKKELLKRPLRGTAGVHPVTPKAPAKPKKQSKLDQRVSQFLHLLDDMLSDSDSVDTPHVTTPPKPKARKLNLGAFLPAKDS